jgi:hypothetical protein
MSNGRNLAANTEFSSLRLCIFACEKKRDLAKTRPKSPIEGMESQFKLTLDWFLK